MNNPNKGSRSSTSKRAPRQVKAMRRPPANPRNQDVISYAPLSISSKVVSRPPKITQRDAKSFRVAHRELVLNSIAGSVAFTVQSYLRLNPGIAATFPWLAPQAAQWDQYTFHKLKAQYVPIKSATTDGDIFLSPNYDASDPQPTTEQQAANNAGTSSDSCWSRQEITLDVKAMMGLGPRKFVRSQAVAGDIKTFDVGTLAICSVNETGTAGVGKLYLEYDVEFFVPNSDPAAGSTSSQTTSVRRNANQALTTAIPAAIVWDTLIFDPLGFGLGALMTPPAGTYLLRAQVGMEDTASEAVDYVLAFAKNGVFTNRNSAQVNIGAGTGAGNIANLNCQEVISFNGTDTLGVWATVTGAAGTLTVVGNQTLLTAELA